MDNTPDYEHNLYFEPSILNQCNSGKRSEDVVVTAIEKCEELQKKLDIAVKALEKLSISYQSTNGVKTITTKALKQIKENK